MLKREKAERRGRRAELVALWFLRLKGYRLLAHRFKSKLGEVDLIMRKGTTTAFIEVKARPTLDEAIFSVSPLQARRIEAACTAWLRRDPKAASGVCRFDIVAVPASFWPKHIENAFTGDH